MPEPSAVLPSFEVGRIYNRLTDLHGPFGGSQRSGISPSKNFPVIFLFTGESGNRHGYADVPLADGSFLYTGEGQQADMVLKRGNLAILNHSLNARALHLFQSPGKGKGQQYLGEFVYDSHTWTDAEDTNGAKRKAIVFKLVPVSRLEHSDLVDVDQLSTVPSLKEARERAVAAAKADGSQVGKSSHRTVYERSRAVRDYVLLRAAGHCELCEQPAPFKRKGGDHYLEPHHTTRVSDGGPDHPRFVAALCPTCHREVHYGEHAKLKNDGLIEKLRSIER
ncbi:HNH endonuclease [Variovorax sp. Varisp41]|uniref:HNH endonuclease n=1 Tax=Variovorax sp. Varisp41 TaxID=3243033 RepID=UPI0039B6E859